MDDDDFGGIFDIDNDDAEAARAAFAGELGDVDTADTMSEIDRAQWNAAFGPYLDAGQVNSDVLDLFFDPDWHPDDEYMLDLTVESPEGDSP